MRWLSTVLLWLALANPAIAEDGGRFVEHEAVATSNIDPPHVVVWLPPGYGNGLRRYPVLYMRDGQNLFHLERSGFNKVWAADKYALRLIAAGKVVPFIVVGVDHPSKDRFRLQYFRAKLPQPAVRQGIVSFAGPLTGDAYLRFQADELKSVTNPTYRTRPQPRFTANAGSSMGGLISLYGLAERPDTFGKAAAVSTHSLLVDPDTLAKTAALADTIKGSWRTYLYHRLGAPTGRRLWMDHGTANLDQHHAPFQRVIDAEVKRLGWRSRVYPGGAHEENAWAGRLYEILGWLLQD